MKPTMLHATVVFLLASVAAGAYEFEAASVSPESSWSLYGASARSADRHPVVPTGEHQVKATVKPEECRFYLTYEDDGRDHVELLRQAKIVGGELEKALADLKQAKVEIVPLNYSPEKSWRGLFVGEKAVIGVSFRVTIQLAVEGDDAFWGNAEVVARVLQKISEARKNPEWGKKLSQGRVTYAVESLEPTKAVLYTRIEEEVRALRKSLDAANAQSLGGEEVFCDVEYGNPATSRVTLEEVEVVLPYSVEFVLRKQGK